MPDHAMAVPIENGCVGTEGSGWYLVGTSDVGLAVNVGGVTNCVLLVDVGTADCAYKMFITTRLNRSSSCCCASLSRSVKFY